MPIHLFRSTLRHEYTIEVLEDRLGKDRLIGKAHFVEVVDNETRSLEYDLLDAENKKAGTVSIILQSYDDILYL